MSNIPENQIADWLKKLERESWQLELLVSAFTIFLLINAVGAFEDFMTNINYQYNFSDSLLTLTFIFLFLFLESLRALTICLIGHLLLRGFWIGTIGLRSVQSTIDFSRLNYSEFFTEKLKNKVISLDQLVIRLDEICSVVFAFAFLVISMLLSFGLYLMSFGAVAILLTTLGELTPDSWDNAIGFTGAFIFLILFLTGVIYMIDYFTLGFFKKIKWFRKVYYPFYRFYSFITLSILSRSIYYYMISKFTKKKIRILYAVVAVLMLGSVLVSFDQHQYFPEDTNSYLVSNNFYDDTRPADDYIESASILSQYIEKPYFPLFIRYDTQDNTIVREHCPDFVPVKDDGINWRFSFQAKDGNVSLMPADHSGEDFDKVMECLSGIYEIKVNDQLYDDLDFFFYEHPAKKQRGLLTIIPTDSFNLGQNVLNIRMIRIIDRDSLKKGYRQEARIPFWYKK